MQEQNNQFNKWSLIKQSETKESQNKSKACKRK